MARIVMLGGASPLPAPSSFALLTYELRTVAVDREIPELDDDLVVVDARKDLSAGRDLCLRLQAAEVPRPVLLLVTAEALPVVSRDWGMDDFVLDSVQPGELEARLRLLMAERSQSSTIECGPVVVDEGAYTAAVGGRSLELTYTEFELLKYLALHPGRVLSREHLLSEVWGYDYYGGTRTVDVHIRRLRAKLGSEYDGHITTVRNVGYRFSATR